MAEGLWAVLPLLKMLDALKKKKNRSKERKSYASGEITSVRADLRDVERVQWVVNGLATSVGIHNANSLARDGRWEGVGPGANPHGPVKVRQTNVLGRLHITATEVLRELLRYLLDGRVQSLLQMG